MSIYNFNTFTNNITKIINKQITYSLSNGKNIKINIEISIKNDKDEFKFINCLAYKHKDMRTPLYICFNNKKDKIDFYLDIYKNIDKLENNEIKRYLEFTIEKYRKLYFDLDWKLPTEYITKSQLDNIILFLKNKLNEVLKINILDNEINTLIKINNEEQIKSVHIIINHFINDKLFLINNQHLKNIVIEHLQPTYPSFDEKPYHKIDNSDKIKSQQFSLYKMSSKSSMDIVFEKHNNNKEDDDDYLCMLLIENILNKPFIHHDLPLQETENITLNIESVNNEDTTEIINDCSSETTNENTIYYTIYNIFDKFIEINKKYPNQYLFNNTNFWKQSIYPYLYYLKKYNKENNKLLIDNLNNYLKITANSSNKYTYEGNKTKIESMMLEVNENNKHYSYSIISDIINKHLGTDYLFDNNNFNEKIINELQDKTGEEYEVIKNLFLKTSDNKFEIKNGLYEYDINKSLLYDVKEQKHILI